VTTVVLLEVSDVFQKYVLRLVLFQDYNDVVEQSPSSIELAVLEPRLRKWLTWESGTEDVVWGDFVVVSSNIPNHVFNCAGKVSNVQLTQLIVHLRREDALMSQSFEGEVKAAEARE